MAVMELHELSFTNGFWIAFVYRSGGASFRNTVYFSQATVDIVGIQEVSKPPRLGGRRFTLNNICAILFPTPFLHKS
jgi:hypothetical protein